jgi:hypothetical protein
MTQHHPGNATFRQAPGQFVLCSVARRTPLAVAHLGAGHIDTDNCVELYYNLIDPLAPDKDNPARQAESDGGRPEICLVSKVPKNDVPPDWDGGSVTGIRGTVEHL